MIPTVISHEVAVRILFIFILAAGGSSLACSATSDASGGAADTVTATTSGAGGQAGGASGQGGAATGGSSTITVGAGGSVPTVDVEVIITADNAYGFGYGSETEMLNYFGGIENKSAGDIFNCTIGAESYIVPAAETAVGKYLYIVAWADKSTTQGVLGKFARVGGDPIYTGQGAWLVCATGQDFASGSGGPSLQQITTQIGQCNAANTDPGTTSVGWVDTTGSTNGKLEFGEDNTTPRTTPVPGNEFPPVCDVDDDAKWMWFNWDPQAIVWPTTGSPFIWPGGQGNPDKQFLIFRLAVSEVPVIN
jgi:hypothetical protein